VCKGRKGLSGRRRLRVRLERRTLLYRRRDSGGRKEVGTMVSEERGQSRENGRLKLSGKMDRRLMRMGILSRLEEEDVSKPRRSVSTNCAKESCCRDSKTDLLRNDYVLTGVTLASEEEAGIKAEDLNVADTKVEERNEAAIRAEVDKAVSVVAVVGVAIDRSLSRPVPTRSESDRVFVELHRLFVGSRFSCYGSLHMHVCTAGFEDI